MLVIIGSIIVMVSVLGGFMMAGGHPAVLLQWSEFVVILGSAFGSMVTMAPMKVHKDLIAQIIGCLKGSPYNKAAYEDMFKALYEVLLGSSDGPRFGGFIALYGLDESIALIEKGLDGALI